MKTKRKEKVKKKEKKRKEAKRKRWCLESNQRPSINRAEALPLGHVERTNDVVEILLLKPSGLIEREFKDIFQKNDSSLDSENPT